MSQKGTTLQQSSKQAQHNKINLLLDLAIFVAFLVIMAPRSSGIAIHEWLSIAFGATLIVHLLRNWQWIMGVTRRFLGTMQWFTRANYGLDLLLFVDMTVIIFSGLLISEHALPLFGLQTARGGIWRSVHELSANLSFVIVGLHLAFNWQWIVTATKSYVFKPLRSRRHATELSREPQPTLPEI